MKLIYRILIRLSLILTIVMTLWGFWFYLTIVDEINDEVDDTLEDYSEMIITRSLAGQTLPAQSDGSNNSYYLTAVSAEYARKYKHVRYSDEMVYIQEKHETEPARILKTIFKDKNHQYFELTVSIPTIEKEDLRDAILNWIILLYITLLTLILVLNIWVFYRSMRPLYTLLKWMDQYTISKEEKVPELKTDITEFRKLHEAAQRSVLRNQAIYEQQKQFIGNASHELQTPLAICQNRLEMLSEGESLTEEQLEEIAKIQSTLSYIIRLNKSLLFLSKIDNAQFPETKTIHLNELLKQQIENYQEIYAYKQITLNLNEISVLSVRMNETLAIALMTNLLKNAYIYSIPQGTIEISVTEYSLKFSNSGIQEPLDTEKIFQRFYQGQNPVKGSSGLGLAIAKAICTLYHFQLNYTYNGTHCFEIIFY